MAKPTNKKATAKVSLADQFDETDANDASSLIPPGQHEVRLNSMELMEDPKKGASVKAEYEAMDGDAEGKKVTQYYKLTDSAGNKAPGMAYLKRDLGILGYEVVSGKELKKVLTELSEEQPMVTINVKQNGQYTNAYIQGLAEDAGGLGGEGDESETTEIEVGDRVKFDDDGTEIEGEVIKIKDDVATVKDDDDDKHKVDLDDLEKVDAEAEDEETETETASEEIEVGSKVTFDDKDGDSVSGQITKINKKKGTCTVEDEDGDDHDDVDLDDCTLVSDEAEAAVEIEEGDDVKWKDDDEDEHTGTVSKIKGDVAFVVDDDTDKKVKVDLSDLEKAD